MVYRTDPAGNLGFPFAWRNCSATWKAPLPVPKLDDRIVGRLKPGAQANVYRGQALMFKEKQTYWVDCTVRLLDPTTAETTFHVEGPMLGGSIQRAHCVGPERELKSRLEAASRVPRGDESAGPAARAGSGFLISQSLVVTSLHVVEHAGAIRCVVAGTPIPARILAQDKNNDVALLAVEPEVATPIPFLAIGDASAVKQGQRVYALGYPLPDLLGPKLSVHEGTVSSLSGFQGSSAQFQVEMSIHPGNSGGPLLNELGAVIGVVMSKLGFAYMLKTGDVPEGITFATKSDLIRSLAGAGDKADQIVYAPGQGPKLSLEQVAEALGSAIVRVGEAGMTRPTVGRPA